MNSNIARAALGLCAALSMLAGCGADDGTSQALPKAAAATRAGRPACPNARDGDARCFALIQSRSGLPPTIAGWAPADFQARYKLPSSTQGAGETVAIVDAYDNPNVATDLAAYRSQFGLTAGAFAKYNQTGQTKNYPAGNAGWGVEIDLDVEMAAAVCPLCTIDLVEANSAKSKDLDTAAIEAVKLGAHVVSNSWGCIGATTCLDREAFRHKGVTYLAASGDAGSGQVGLPAALDSVVAAGATVLSKNGSQYTETIYEISEGGCAMGIKKPKWQHDAACSYRLANDASAVGANVAAYDTYGYGGWFTLAGTSVSTPLLAGMFALAGNASHQDGGRTFWQLRHRKFLYDLSGSCNGGYTMGQYTTCAGWGSPDGIGAL
jgi:subtilase family serine protease